MGIRTPGSLQRWRIKGDSEPGSASEKFSQSQTDHHTHSHVQYNTRVNYDIWILQVGGQPPFLKFSVCHWLRKISSETYGKLDLT